MAAVRVQLAFGVQDACSVLVVLTPRKAKRQAGARGQREHGPNQMRLGFAPKYFRRLRRTKRPRRRKWSPRPRARSIPNKRLTRKEIKARDDAAERTILADILAERPWTRGDCKDMPRPCPFISCRHHLYLDVNEETGSVKLNFPDVGPDELEKMADTCVLDVADRVEPYELTIDEIGQQMNLSVERIRQVEAKALREVLVKIRRVTK